ncbi:DNA primase large subunit PriL [Methanotrichaceae archaeon M04Ac]|uniref:DNA primase large subunit PriL n=1 Tax=Candidatus Methanocrinis alkalitolerans TaxID=3033395 RepID=A0ABT5XGV8_9EURY|nr:DNA primase large subunit PriL [Candidatus Methanocrinis alkalitolerans]MCR3883483.1 DNA primase large subunit PriL [Methanothrix sp.]MDF0593863.1 DNA primase large subunit PriL [Candidatus Methanocrinis alkalitolerans]
MSLADYPFSREAALRVAETGYSLEGLVVEPNPQPRLSRLVRRRALDRVLGSLRGEIPDSAAHPLAELLSYPLARVMVSCINDDLLIRRYALAEAKLASRKMVREELGDLLLLARDLSVDPRYDPNGLFVHFSDYLKAASGMRSPGWKLVNRSLEAGWVAVTDHELARLLEERAKERVQKGLPLKVPPEICEGLGPDLTQVKEELLSRRAKEKVDLGEVTEEAFPPCIRGFLGEVAAGTNLAHTARFALTTFLLAVGMKVDEVVAVFNTSPDFDEERTRYQVEHIAGRSGTAYKPPSCATMATYGNCPGEDRLCRWVNHPLSYYERKAKKRGSG